MDLPRVIYEIVDDLQPLLTSYEAAFYWYAFRQSIARDGSTHVRLPVRRLCRGVVKSARSGRDESPIAEGKVREILRTLENIGAIRKEGEPGRKGTLYRVLVPDEIEACRRFRAERNAAKPSEEPEESEIDYYNVRENRLKIYERDGYRCRYCGKQLTPHTVTLDHVKPVAEHGDNSHENLLTACLECNSRKNIRNLGDFLAET
jgi:5-methylcytosine-specific restriction endonuclease McrA